MNYEDDPDASLDHASGRHEFSLQHLVWAVQSNADVKAVARYLKCFTPMKMRDELRNKIKVSTGGPSFPILYFAVERNSPELVRLLCNSGADPGQRMRPDGLVISKLPLLAYAVLSAENDLSDTTDTVIALLAMGAKPGDIPRVMWENYLVAPTKDSPRLTGVETEGDRWCTLELREALCRNLNLMQRYTMWKSDTTIRPTERKQQVTAEHNIAPLFEAVYHIIGQDFATDQIVHCIADFLLYGDEEPLVVLFTGPSGHGKTELARQMGQLLSLEMHTVDSTEMKTETDLFGPKSPYRGYEEGAPLNNFLWQNAGKTCVVFLDEVDKMPTEARNSLLKLVESGTYRDRRNSLSCDSSKVIWILAANLGCELIQNLWVRELKDQTKSKQRETSLSKLERSLQEYITIVLGAPFASRLKAIVPFMPFTAGEQAVATYKFMRKVWTDVRKPIDEAQKRFARHIYLNYNDDSSIASHIANKNYSADTGARLLERAVNQEIRRRLTRVFLDGDGTIKDEMNVGPLQNFEVRLITVEEGVDEIAVESRGTRQTQTRAETKGR